MQEQNFNEGVERILAKDTRYHRDAYAFVRAASPTLSNGKLKINTASNTELASGAYPARITGDTNIQFEAIFQKLL